MCNNAATTVFQSSVSFKYDKFSVRTNSLISIIRSSDDEDEDDNAKTTFGGRDGVIFLIDAGDSMFNEHESQEACFRTAIQCVEVTMMNRIITSEKDLVNFMIKKT